ncbi:KAP family P-loop NTPase fold protein [Xanthomonas arboricola]|uniref:KAP family P-loop NTPase fold protein n=1 Tax=Xanthomonas arboricola TaxID=56448 RepID=UPI001620B3BD|nr:P-loop NTPase fold protein [Xanthomonas arboricola]MBB3759200.1 hypothetical protein [Xanthomonas arboricola]
MTLHKIPARAEVLEENPWEGDLLKTEESGRMLQGLIENLEIPYVIALHGEWGAGKTTFLRRLARSLEKNNTPVIEVDAWSTDHQDDPIFAILSATIERLEKVEGREAHSGDLRNKIFGAGAAVIAPLSKMAGTAIDVMTATPVGSVGAAIAGVGAKYLEAHVTKASAELEFNAAMKDARDRLLRRRGGESLRGRKVVVIIDELDRCRPLFAIKMLERVKHLFEIDGFLFVISTDGKNLPEAVRSVYGGMESGERYLRRFFDFEFRLPKPNARIFNHLLRSSFGFYRVDDADVERSLRDWQHAKTSLTSGDGVPAPFNDSMSEGLMEFEELTIAAGTSLRDMAQSFNALFAYLTVNRGALPLFAPVAAFICYMRYLSPVFYERFREQRIDFVGIIKSTALTSDWLDSSSHFYLKGFFELYNAASKRQFELGVTNLRDQMHANGTSSSQREGLRRLTGALSGSSHKNVLATPHRIIHMTDHVL